MILLTVVIIYSCEKSDESILYQGFRIEISDGTLIKESDILFYDSSSCTLYLKNDIYISYIERENTNIMFEIFTVFVNSDTIYQGIIYPRDYDMSSLPPKPYIIYRDRYDRSLMKINFIKFYSIDRRYDPRIINSLQHTGLLRSGISLTIDSVSVDVGFPLQRAFARITLVNHDLQNYYILDPQKMGEEYYSVYNRGLVFTFQGSKYVSDFNGIYSSEYGTIDIDDFSILKAGSTLSLSFSSSKYFIGFEGMYDCQFTVRYNNSMMIPLQQPDGRIWVGSETAMIQNIPVKWMP